MKRTLLLVLMLLCSVGMPLCAVADSLDPMLGDCDGNGKVERIDAQLLLQWIIEGRDDLSDQFDFDRNGSVNSDDASAILRYLDSGEVFPVPVYFDASKTVMYTGENVFAAVSVKAPGITAHVSYTEKDRKTVGVYDFCVTLTARKYRLPGEEYGRIEVVKPYFDVSRIDLSALSAYGDLKNRFVRFTAPDDLLKDRLPDGVTVKWQAEDLRRATDAGERIYLVTANLSEPTNLHRPIPKLVWRLLVKDLWTDWQE